MAKICSSQGCRKTVNARGLCSAHYAQWRRSVAPPCSVDSCSRPQQAMGLCSGHYTRSLKGHDLSKPLQHKLGGRCSRPGCSFMAAKAGLCNRHYICVRRYGEDARLWPRMRGDRDNSWKAPGTRKVTSDGYIDIKLDDVRWEREHRHVMSQMIGRPLLPHENVHHKNGDRSDNRPENLELWSKVQPAGQRVSDKLAWAREIIALYGGTICDEDSMNSSTTGGSSMWTDQSASRSPTDMMPDMPLTSTGHGSQNTIQLAS